MLIERKIQKNKYMWHSYFVLIPMSFTNDETTDRYFVWLETIERKKTWSWSMEKYIHIYRIKTHK